MLKKLGALAALLLACSWSAEAQNAVKMTQADGEEVIFLLSDTPSVSFDDDSIVVTCNDEKITCDLTGGISFEFINFENSSVESIESVTPVFKVNNSFIEAANLIPGSPVIISDLSGKIMYSSYIDANGYVYVTVEDYPAGVYIFNSKDKNFKFYKK